MNILHLATHVDIGGITSYIATLSKALAKKGHRSGIVSSGGNAWASLTRSGVLCYDFPIRTKSEFNPMLWWSLPQIAQLVRQEGYQILHAHSRVTQVLAWVVSRMTGVPYVSTAHGFYRPRLGRRLFPAWGERVIAISPLVAESLEKDHRVSPAKIRTVPNAIDLDVFKRRLGQQDREWMRFRYGIPKDAVVVGTLSRLVKDKGHEFLIEAVRRSLTRHPRLFLLIVGDGREKEALFRKASEALPGRFKMIAGVQDTTAVLRMMDLFAHPATWREGFGLSIAEAMVARLPVIATDIPAINTLLKDGVNGRVVKPSDAAALSEAVEALLADPQAARNLAEKGYETAVSVCRPDRLADEVESVYTEVLAGRKKN